MLSTAVKCAGVNLIFICRCRRQRSKENKVERFPNKHVPKLLDYFAGNNQTGFEAEK